MADIQLTAEIDRGPLLSSIRDAERLAETGFNRIRDIGISALAAIGTGVAFGTLINQLMQVGDAVREITRGAEEFGLTVEQFQRLQDAARRTGIFVQRLGDFYKDFRERLGEARLEGTGELQDAFELLGLDPSSFPDAAAALTAFLDRVEMQAPEAQRALQAMAAGIGADLDLSSLREVESIVNGLGDAPDVEILSQEQVSRITAVRGQIEEVRAAFEARFTAAFLDDLETGVERMSEIDTLAESIGGALGSAASELVAAAEEAAGIINRIIEFRRERIPAALQLDLQSLVTGLFTSLGSQIRDQLVPPRSTIATGFLPSSFAPPPPPPTPPPIGLPDRLTPEQQAVIDAGDALVAAYQRQAIAAQGLTREQELLAQVNAGLVTLTDEQLRAAQAYAREIDVLTAAQAAAIETERRRTEFIREQTDAQRRQLDDFAALRGRLDPAADLQRQFDQESATIERQRLLGQLGAPSGIDQGEADRLQSALDQQFADARAALEPSITQFVGGIVQDISFALDGTADQRRAIIIQWGVALIADVQDALAGRSSSSFGSFVAGLIGGGEESAVAAATEAARFGT